MTDVCAQCETPTLVEEQGTRTELGRELPYKYHVCSTCSLKQATFEDLQWNANKMREFYNERHDVIRRSLSGEQRIAYLKAWLWCFKEWLKVVFEIPPWPYHPTITTDIEERVIAITVTDDEHRINGTYWPRKEKK